MANHPHLNPSTLVRITAFNTTYPDESATFHGEYRIALGQFVAWSFHQEPDSTISIILIPVESIN